ncbi:hypothetical protein BN1708_012629 [Verticillium longisporum]|uniref:AMP-binding enzyme C-terminal domain-containing protein n=1 Tax=Verticillium longisporum TaxID=100787 RepID=A0A0G4LBV5_VERLO|nr:hypothetical protein BN1708_012629 [Verticillium longisporum]
MLCPGTDSSELPSKDDTILHVEASNPGNHAHILRHDFGVGAPINGQDVVVCISSGEVLLQIVTPGYGRNPMATVESFTSKFYIVDRKKGLIKYKGLQVAPAELQALLLSNLLILDAAVIGVAVPTEERNEVPRAYIVADANKISEGEVKAFFKRDLASYKQLRGGVSYVKAILKSPTGKILRRELRELFERQSSLPAKL